MSDRAVFRIKHCLTSMYYGTKNVMTLCYPLQPIGKLNTCPLCFKMPLREFAIHSSIFLLIKLNSADSGASSLKIIINDVRMM